MIFSFFFCKKLFFPAEWEKKRFTQSNLRETYHSLKRWIGSDLDFNPHKIGVF